jgi:hypothetical protein
VPCSDRLEAAGAVWLLQRRMQQTTACLTFVGCSLLVPWGQLQPQQGCTQLHLNKLNSSITVLATNQPTATTRLTPRQLVSCRGSSRTPLPPMLWPPQLSHHVLVCPGARRVDRLRHALVVCTPHPLGPDPPHSSATPVPRAHTTSLCLPEPGPHHCCTLATDKQCAQQQK